MNAQKQLQMMRWQNNALNILEQLIQVIGLYKYMDQQNHLESNEQKIRKLHILAQQLSDRPPSPDKLLRQYISLYVESHHLSEEYFTTLCQHRFMVVLLDNSNRITESTSILQCLNLLLTNTKYSQELVYILSQNALHEYLFSADVLQRDSQFIEYYVQLLKTILLKLSEGEQNKSLIRMFCNNKYPNFPLLTYTTILANDANELIKVTAQQCILILVGMINERKMYQIYLCEPPMLIFIVRLATEFLKPDTDHEGICKYLADLMYELRNNRTPLFLFSNAICNVIIISSLPKKVHIALSFVQTLTKSIQTRVVEHKNILTSSLQKKEQKSYYKSKPQKMVQYFQQEACDILVTICTTFYRVLIKYMTNKYINATYLAAFVQINPNPIPIEEQIQISLPLKVIYPGNVAQLKILQDYSIKKYVDEEYSRSEVEMKMDIMDQIQEKIIVYGSSKEFAKLKQNYLKKSNYAYKSAQTVGFFGRIFNRGTAEQLNTQYMKHISDFTAVNIIKGEPVVHSITKLLNASYCPFFSQYILLNNCLKSGIKYDGIKTGQESDSVQPDQIHFNDVRSLWSFNNMNLDIILYMAKRFIQFINSELSQTSLLVVPKMYIPPAYLFLGQLKDYLSCSIQEHINKQKKNIELNASMPMLLNLSKICSLLNVQLTETSYSCLIVELTAIHQQIQTCLFQNGFLDVVDYIKTKNKLAMIQMEEKSKVPKLAEEEKISNIKIKVKPGITFIKLGSFEAIQKIMDPHIKPLTKHFQSKWKFTFNKIPTQFQQFYQENLSTFKVSYFGKNGCTLSFMRLMMPSTIALRIELGNKKLLQTDILEIQSIRKNLIDNRVLQFDGNVENVKVQSAEIGEQIILKLTQYRFMLQQYITNATLEYLSSTNETLNLKGRKMNRSSSTRYSVDFQTPQ